MIMNMFDFLKRDASLILISLFVIGVAVLAIVFISDIDEPAEAASVFSEPLTENNEPTTEKVVEKKTTKAKTIEATTEEITEYEPVKYYDVPLDADLQVHIVNLCCKYGIEPSLVFAIIQKESNFDPNVIGDGGNSYGLMQIQEQWHIDRMARLECPELLNPYQNVEVGIDILAELFGRNDDVMWVLMAYNGGESYATEMVNDNRISEYARLVLWYKGQLEKIY